MWLNLLRKCIIYFEKKSKILGRQFNSLPSIKRLRHYHTYTAIVKNYTKITFWRMRRFRRIWLRLLCKSSIACALRNSRIWVALFNRRHNPPMKCRKLYGNHLVKLLSCSHARLSNMNSSEVRMTFSKLVHRPVRRNNDSLWYITCRNTWQLQTTNEIPGKVYSGEYFIVLWTPWNTKNSYFMQFRHALLPRAALTPRWKISLIVGALYRNKNSTTDLTEPARYLL